MAAAIQQTVTKNSLDAQRVYVTGLSAGGAMTAVMLADYPDKGSSHTTFAGFNGGAIMAGLPFNTACTGQTEDTCPSSSTSYGDAFTAMASGKPSVTAQQWGDRVRATSPNSTTWPRVSVWGGTSDTTVAPANADELVLQWSNLHGLSTQTASETVDGATHMTYADSSGTVLVEQYRIPNMTHGTATDPSFEFGSSTGAMCGTAASYILAEGICSTFYALVFWGEISATDGSEQTGSAPTSPTSPTSPTACTAVTATHTAHVAAGRAVDLLSRQRDRLIVDAT
jgi:feruloyl esterase